MFAQVNFMLIGLAAIARFGFGWLWYGLILPSQWKAAMKDSKRDVKKIDSKKAMVGCFVGSLALSYVLYYFISILDLYIFRDAALFAIFIWFGFLAVSELESVFYEGKTWKLFFINSGYQLISVVLMAGIFAVWR